MRGAIIENGVVVNVIIADVPEDFGAVECPDDVSPGWSYADGAFIAPAVEVPQPALSDYENAIQGMVDATARERLFRDGVTLASYTASTNPQWAAEAAAFVAWRDGVWTYAYAELAKVQGGLRSQPAVEDFLTEIDPITWPG